MRTLDALRRDLHHALWQLLANRGFASAAAVSLALGIGANTAIFCLVNEVLLRSLPVTDPGELVLFRAIEGGDGRMARAGENNGFVDPGSGRTSTTSFSLLTFERLRGQRSALSDVFAFAPLSQPNVVVDVEPEVSSRLIATMLFGVSPADPARYGGVAVMLTAVALMASLVPGGAPVASTGCRHCGRMTVVIRASLAIAALVAGVIALPSFGEAIRPAGSVAPQNDSGRTPLADRVRRLTRDSR